MNKVQINKIKIKGIRGIKDNLSISLSKNSIIIYGDSGTGKSSISDSIEWFLKDEVRHLSCSEIDLKDALRNSNMYDSDESTVNITFSNNSINSQKTLFLKRGKYVTEYSNNNADFKNYLEITRKENLILRYQHLTEFIDKTKGDKLRSLSDVIGFSEVNKTKDVLRKTFNSLKTEIKNQNFENQIITQKEILKEKVGAIVSIESNLIEIINEIIKPLKLDIELKSIGDIDIVLNNLKVPMNTALLNELKFLETCRNILIDLKHETELVHNEYKKFYNEFYIITNDVQSIRQTFLSEMLKAGHIVLEKEYHKEDTCPLCLQSKKRENLLNEIKQRLQEIEESTRKKASYDNAKQTILSIINERIKRLEFLFTDVLINEPKHSIIKEAINMILVKFRSYLRYSNEKVTSGNKIASPKDLLLNKSDFTVIKELENRITLIKKTIEKDNTTAIYSNISSAKDAFFRIKKFESEKSQLEKQKDTLEIIYNEFVKKQKEELQNFVNSFSGEINDYYQYMNPGEQFDDIKIVTMGEDDELTGITIEYKYKSNWVSPPQKYFSESHLSCFGISFFLASVVAFNHINKFIILDDVISSFDTNHRKRFADLLFEKFSDYQIILLTHEINWFEYVQNAVKNKNWQVKKVKWTETKETHFDDTPEKIL